MQPVEPDPADVATAARNACAADRFDERGDARASLGRERDRDEQPATRQVGAGPAGRRPATVTPSGGRVGRVGPLGRLAVPGRSVGAQDLERPIAIAPAEDLDGLVLERLVRLEEVLDLDQSMRPDLVETLDVLLVGIADGDAQDLEVEALLVVHLEAADRAGPDVAAGEGRLVDDQEGVGVVAVAGARALDEAVVEVVEDGARQDAVEPEDARRLVVLVLVAAAPRDLDDDLDDIGERTGLFTRSV